jgi:hypothetical protein
MTSTRHPSGGNASCAPLRWPAVLCVCVLAACGAASCTRSPDDSALTVGYYRAHPAERHTMVDACANDPGHTGERAACTNAREAERIDGIGSLRDLPPMGLPLAKPKPGASR